MPKVSLRGSQELFGHAIVLGVRIVNPENFVTVETQQCGAGVRENDRRVCRD
jgi:hypothetical protein